MQPTPVEYAHLTHRDCRLYNLTLKHRTAFVLLSPRLLNQYPHAWWLKTQTPEKKTMLPCLYHRQKPAGPSLLIDWVESPFAGKYDLVTACPSHRANNLQIRHAHLGAAA